ncbi:2-amino-4-hydroxy-6-hydroxymethyldihydropteridine diphosphokinase [Pseudomonas stutzeri]|nr:2-amino-4-hydroxy-6-hydroxymethyldihydropteridine diphosphokinase [Stutzerimonas stutzeri]
MPLSTVFLGLGSNIERHAHLSAGLDALAAILVDLRCSPVFESEAVGIRSGPFYNLAVMAQTELPLAELDRRLKVIEADNGRYAPERKGLPLDIDVLLYDDLVGDFDGLQLPRAEILRNAFVLWPLALLAPAARHPGEGRSFAALWQAMRSEQRLWPVSFIWRGMELTPAELRSAFPAPAQ